MNVQNHGKNLAIHYRGEEEVRRGNIHVDRFSAEEMARPCVPHGINVYLTLGVSTGGATITGAARQTVTLLTKKLSPDEPTYDLLGTSHLSSAYSFGLLESATIEAPTVGRGKRYENVSISFDRVEPLPRATVRLLIPQLPNETDLREP